MAAPPGCRTTWSYPFVLMVAGCGVLAASDAVSKLLVARYPPGEIVCLRALLALIILAPLAARSGALSTALRRKALPGQCLRALFDVLSMVLLVYGLSRVSFGEATILMLTGPLFIAVIAPLLLSERLGARRLAAIVAGFLGATIVARPVGVTFDAALLWILGAALTGALRDVVTRFIGLRQPALATQTFTTMFAFFGGAATLAIGWTWPTTQDLALMALASLLFTVAHYLFIEAFRHGEATLLAPFKYTLIPWALVLGFFLWGETPNLRMIAGAAVIALAGLYLIYGERQRRRQ